MCEGFQSLFPRNLGAGAFLLLVGEVEIFQLLELLSLFDGLAQLRGQFSLLINFAEDLFLSLYEIPEVGDALLNAADLFLVKGAGRFFAVAGDEGPGIASVQEFHNGVHLPGAYFHFGSNGRGDFFYLHNAPAFFICNIIITLMFKFCYSKTFRIAFRWGTPP